MSPDHIEKVIANGNGRQNIMRRLLLLLGNALTIKKEEEKLLFLSSSYSWYLKAFADILAKVESWIFARVQVRKLVLYIGKQQKTKADRNCSSKHTEQILDHPICSSNIGTGMSSQEDLASR